LFILVIAANNREYILIQKDDDNNQAPQTHFSSFDGFSQASIIPKTDFPGEFNKEFIVRMWMKHTNEGSDDKEHIFCKSDQKRKTISIFDFIMNPIFFS